MVGIFFSLLRWVCEFDGREAQSKGESKSRVALNEVIYREVPPQGPISSLILYAILITNRNKDPFLYQARTLHPLNYCKCKLSFSQPKMRPLARLSPFTDRNDGFLSSFVNFNIPNLLYTWTQLFKSWITLSTLNKSLSTGLAWLVSLKLIRWIVIYPVDSAINKLLNNCYCSKGCYIWAYFRILIYTWLDCPPGCWGGLFLFC